MKKIKIWIIVLIIVLVLAAGGAFAALYFLTDIFKQDNELFVKYFAQNKTYKQVEVEEDFKQNKSYQTEGDVQISVQNTSNTQEINANTLLRHDANTGRSYAEMVVKNGDADLLKFSYINSDDVYAVKWHDVYNNYIGIRNSDLQSFARNMGLDESTVQSLPNSIDFDSMKEIIQLTDEQKKHISDTYLPIILSYITKERTTKIEEKQIMVDTQIYEAIGYQLTLNQNDIAQIILDVLNTLKSDTATLSVIANDLSFLGFSEEYTDATKLSEMIQDLLEELQSKEVTGQAEMKITVYESEGQTVRREFEFFDSVITIDTPVTTGNVGKALVFVSDLENSSSTKFSIQKSVTDTEVTNEIMILPDADDEMNYILITSTNGKWQNNQVNNSFTVTIGNYQEGITDNTIYISYSGNTKIVDQVEEIMELKNSNSVILNNYKIKQLVPFFTQLQQIANQVLQNKLMQLAVNL